MENKEKQRLKQFVNKLASFRGRHTELVSVYVPSGYDLTKIIQHLAQEQGTASNIKDKTTRNHVIDSLEKMIRHLRVIGKTPENGLAVFCGNVSDKESQVDIQVFSIEPPKQIKTRIYRCDQSFVLEILREMMEHTEIYGLIVIDRREGNIGLLKGTSVVELAGFTSDVPGKTTKGGQSQQRYARLRDIAAADFFKKVAEAVNKEFLEMKNLKGILLGGPGPTKEDFLNGSYLNNELKKKVLGVKDLGYTGDVGLQELVSKSQDLLAKEAITQEKQVMEEFFKLLNTDDAKVAYGEKEVLSALDAGAVKILLVSEDFDEDKVESFERKADETSAEVKFISTDTQEGAQLVDLGGIAAILRFALH
tara:strand:- start:1846 stop:2937 length:1092 start_codon:yes stop_codon:yes gene_type:complete